MTSLPPLAAQAASLSALAMQPSPERAVSPLNGLGEDVDAFWASAIDAKRRSMGRYSVFGASGFIVPHPLALRVGIAGFSRPDFDREQTERVLRAVFFSLARQWAPQSASRVTVVAGLTDVGISSIGYRLAEELGWRTRGVASLQAFGHPWFPVDRALLSGSRWGDESQAFIGQIDAFVRVGGGHIARNEEKMARDRHLPTLAFEAESGPLFA